MNIAQHAWTVIMVLVGLNGGLAVHQLRVAHAFQFHALSVGQGDAILLVTPDQHHVLIDGGPGSSVTEELGETLPLLYRDIDLMVLTHPHLDHLEGLISVLDHYSVKALLLSAPHYSSDAYAVFLERVTELGIPVYFAEADTDFKLGDLKLDVLYPFESVTGESFENVNNVSVVIRADFENHSMMLMGDAEQEVEAELLEHDVVHGPVDILKAGHHGSRTSSTEAFLEAVQPKLMVISCGDGNDFGHPHPETLEKAARLQIPILRTDTSGRVSVVFRGRRDDFGLPP